MKTAGQDESFDDAMARLMKRLRPGQFIADEVTFDLELASLEALGRSVSAAKVVEIAEQEEFIRRRVTENALQDALTTSGGWSAVPEHSPGAEAIVGRSKPGKQFLAYSTLKSTQIGKRIIEFCLVPPRVRREFASDSRIIKNDFCRFRIKIEGSMTKHVALTNVFLALPDYFRSIVLPVCGLFLQLNQVSRLVGP